MFAVTSAICDNLRAKGKWAKKKHCILCATVMTRCKKLIEDEDRKREENSDKFNETRDFAREGIDVEV